MLYFKRLLFVIFFITNLFAQQKDFTISYDPDYAPFSYLEKGKPQGLLIDYWKLWAEKNNYNIKFINGRLWNDALSLAKKGEVDFFLGTDPYEDWMKSSNTFYKTQTSIFINKENAKGFSKTAAYIIAVIGYDYKEHIEKHFPNSQVLVYEDYNTVFKDFLSRKVDLIYDDKIAIEFYTLRNDNFHTIRSIDLLNEATDIRAISNRDELIKIFNEGFNNISTDELYDIESKWIINKEHRYYKSKGLKLSDEEKDFIKNNVIKVSASKSWRPFNFYSNGKANGISYEFWQLISKKSNIKSSYSFYDNFTNQLKAIKDKKEDIIYSVGITKDRKEYAIFSNTYYSFPLSIATLKDENFIENISQILNKTIAVGENFTAHKMLKEKYPDIKLKLVPNIKEGLNSVINKEAFAFVDIKPNLEYNIKKLALDDLKITGNTGLTFDLSIMIRDDYPILKSILDKTINSLNKEEVTAIINRWANIQFEKETDYSYLWILAAISLTLILLVFYKDFITSKENKKLESLVEKRTKDLKELTQNLENTIKEKTKELTKVNYILDEAQKIAHLGSFQYNFKKDQLTFSNELYKMLNLNKDVKPSFPIALSFVHEEDREEVSQILEKAINASKSISMEFRLIVNGKTKYIQAQSKITKFDEDNSPILFIGTVLDLTKIKNLEKEKREKDTILAQQAKMAAMGEMLENIAHQWRQPLSVISTASTGLQLKLELGEEVSNDKILENIITVNKQAQYLSKTIEDFRNFFNPNKIKLDFNIKHSIDKSLQLIKSRVKTKNVNIIQEVEDINIFTLENELIQVLINLLNNAIDAFNKKESNYIFIKTSSNEENLLIEITDNAGGVSPKIINRIFEPYFTTKHKSQGTGIGLYMSNEIITTHLGGTINVTNKSYTYDNIPFYGACFIIVIPLKMDKTI